MDERSDDDLLAATRAEPEAFAVFYRRHVDSLLAYFARRTRDAELAADLTAETFAAALVGAHRHRPDHGPAVAWLYGIARRKLVACRPPRRGRGPRPAAARHGAADAHRRGARARGGAGHRRRLRATAREGLEALPADQREAVLARVLDEQDYAEIAATARTSESVVRKRVSRGLAGLRSRLEGQ